MIIVIMMNDEMMTMISLCTWSECELLSEGRDVNGLPPSPLALLELFLTLNQKRVNIIINSNERELREK